MLCYNNAMHGYKNNTKDKNIKKIYKGDVTCVKGDVVKKIRATSKKGV
ncbi:hypothetical protein AGMMS50233_02220 [Endomicrobiia bacterium]|nr:hypothetical protein AGMMS50233_02220 [Endomicrobiia bacterium]